MSEISWIHSPPETLRAAHLADALALEGPMPEGVAEAEIPRGRAFRGGLLFTPEGAAPGRAITCFHGGGWVAGSPRTHRVGAAWLAKRSGMAVLSARYRLAPEHPFPAQAEDGQAAAAWAAARFAEVSLCGDSAGAAVCLWALAAGAQAARTALIYGAFGLRDSPSIRAWGTARNGLDGPSLAAMLARLGDAPGVDLLSSGFAWRGDFLLLAGERDAVRDDSEAMADRLIEAGANAQLRVAPGLEHGFLKRAGADARADAELQLIADWLAGR